jgi:hypothetical protein
LAGLLCRPAWASPTVPEPIGGLNKGWRRFIVTDTESLLQFITNELDDKTLDQIEVHRNVAEPDNLATEPLTIAAALLLSPPLVVAVESLADLSKAHAKVSIEYRLPTAPSKRR